MEKLLQKITLRDCFASNHVLPKQENEIILYNNDK